jgi:recombinational DNA repair protein RecR
VYSPRNKGRLPVVGQSADEMKFNVLATSRSYVDCVQVAILELAASAEQCALAGNHTDPA